MMGLYNNIMAINEERGNDNGDFDYDSVTSDISGSSDGDDGDDDDYDEYDDDCNNERVIRNVGIEPPEARTTSLRRVNSHNMEPPPARRTHDTNKSTLRRIHSHNNSSTNLKALGLKKRISKDELKKLYNDCANTSRELIELKDELTTIKYQLLLRNKELKDIRIERGEYIRKIESLEETNDNLVSELSSMKMSSSSDNGGRGRGNNNQRNSRTSNKSNSSSSRKNSKSTNNRRDISDKSITIMDSSFASSPTIDYGYGDITEDMNNNSNNNNNSSNSYNNSYNNSKTSMGGRSRLSRRNSTSRRSSIRLGKPDDDDDNNQDYNGIATKATRLGNNNSSSSRDINSTKKKKTKDKSRRALEGNNSSSINNNSISSINEEESESRHSLLKHDEPLKSKRSQPKNGSKRMSRRSSML